MNTRSTSTPNTVIGIMLGGQRKTGRREPPRLTPQDQQLVADAILEHDLDVPQVRDVRVSTSHEHQIRWLPGGIRYT